MHASFGIERERYNKLFYKSYKNDKGALHFHSQIELYFVDDGQMEVFVSQQRRLLSKDEMSVALSYEAHSYKTPEYSKSSVLIIPTYLCEDFLGAIARKRACSPFICDHETVRRIRCWYDCLAAPTTNEITRRGCIYMILGCLLDALTFETADSSLDPDLSSRLLFYMNEHFRNDLSLSALSSAFGYSPSYISRYFKNCFHIGINQYLAMLRLKNALMLMGEKKYSMTYCALESGFRSMRTFYRVFFQEFQCSPKEYLAQGNIPFKKG